jgi:hypothetical protein
MTEQVVVGAAVECVTVHVRKRRWQRLGLELEGRGPDDWPKVHSSTDARFRVGDVVYMINGRETRGPKRTARRIVWKRRMSITLLRVA